MKSKHDPDRILELLACFPAIIVHKRRANGVLIQLPDLLFKINMRPLSKIVLKLCIQVTNSLESIRPS